MYEGVDVGPATPAPFASELCLLASLNGSLALRLLAMPFLPNSIANLVLLLVRSVQYYLCLLKANFDYYNFEWLLHENQFLQSTCSFLCLLNHAVLPEHFAFYSESTPMRESTLLDL